MIVDLKDMRCHMPARLRGKKIYELVDVDVCPDGGRPSYMKLLASKLLELALHVLLNMR